MEVKNIPVSASSSSSSSSSRDKFEPIGLPDGISRRFSQGFSFSETAFSSKMSYELLGGKKCFKMKSQGRS